MVISSVEIKQWINTNKKLIETSRITQIYRYNKKELVISLNTKEGKKFLTIQVPNTIFLTDFKPEGNHKDTGFGRWLRNNLKGHIIENIDQIRAERIVIIKTRFYIIYIELFGKGNITICDNENKILITIEKQEMKDRSIVKGGKYNLPESFDSFNSDEETIKSKIKECENETISISKFLATKMRLGGEIANNILTNLNIEDNNNINLIPIDKLKNEINKIIRKEIDINKLKSYYKKEETYSETELKIKKIQSIINAQKKNKEDVIKKSDNFSKQGEYIYNNYQFFEELKKAYDFAEKNKKEFTQQIIEKLKQKHNISEEIIFQKPKVIIQKK